MLTDDIKPWWIWGYWASPMMYSQNALSVNEFLASRWASVSFFYHSTPAHFFLEAHITRTHFLLI
jgi:hypothetical protein